MGLTSFSSTINWPFLSFTACILSLFPLLTLRTSLQKTFLSLAKTSVSLPPSLLFACLFAHFTSHIHSFFFSLHLSHTLLSLPCSHSSNDLFFSSTVLFTLSFHHC